MIAQLTLFIFLLFTSNCTHLIDSHSKQLSIMQGLTSEKTVEFSILTNEEFRGTFKVKTIKDEYFNPVKTQKIDLMAQDKTIYKLLFEIPKEFLSEELSLQVFKDHTLTEERFFRMFSNSEVKLKFVALSCMNGIHENKNEIWKKVLSTNPEIIFLIGDNLYFSKSNLSPEEMTKELIDFRETHPMFFSKQLHPIHAIWDDNDYGMKNGNSSYSYKDKAKELFETFYAQSLDQSYIDKGPGVSSRLHLRGMHFVFLDNRTFRDPKPEGSHFGKEQEDWLFKGLESNLPTWIISGDQFFGKYHPFDSFEGSHPNSFKEFMNRLHLITSPFIFMSGDRHMSEIMQFPTHLLGQLSYEITSSPLLSKLYPGNLNRFPNPWRVSGIDDQINFLWVETSLLEQGWDLNIRFYGLQEKPLLSRDLTLHTEQLKEFTIDKKIQRRKYRKLKTKRI
jgi:hypothetical protein